MKNVLITGGAGFIGRHLADHLAGRVTSTVTVIDNESLGDRAHLDLDRVRFIAGDLRDRDDLRAALQGQDAVVHLAADTRVMDSIENPAHNFENNVVGTFNLLELCRELGVSRIVAASTGGAILGDVEPPVHERMAPQPTSPYGASKLMLEGYLERLLGSYGVSGCASGSPTSTGRARSTRARSSPTSTSRFWPGSRSSSTATAARPATSSTSVTSSRRIWAAVESDAEGAYQLGSGNRPRSTSCWTPCVR